MYSGTGGISTTGLWSEVVPPSNVLLSQILFGSGSGIALVIVQMLARLWEGWTGEPRAAARPAAPASLTTVSSRARNTVGII